MAPFLKEEDRAAGARAALGDEGDFRRVDRSEILKIVEQSEGIERTRKLADGYAHRAIQMISEFPPSIYRDAMERIPHFILNRNA